MLFDMEIDNDQVERLVDMADAENKRVLRKY